METTAIPPTTPPAMAPAFELELLPLVEAPDAAPVEVDLVAVPVVLAALETPEGPITPPGPTSGASENVGVRQPRKKGRGSYHPSVAPCWHPNCSGPGMYGQFVPERYNLANKLRRCQGEPTGAHAFLQGQGSGTCWAVYWSIQITR